MTDARGDIIETITRMAVLTDTRRWEDLVDAFTPEVRVDYTSLNGGQPASVPASDLVAGWAASLGRLGSTQHLAADHLVTVEGATATATATFQATHVAAPPDTRHWVLGGDWRFELSGDGDGWRIAAVTMTTRWETGDRVILDPTSDPAATVAQRFLDRLTAMDVNDALACFADDAVQELPFAPEGFPTRLDGIAELRRQYGGLPDAYRSQGYPVEAVHPMSDPEWVLLEYRGEVELTSGGRYDNRYAGLFHVVDGRIRLFREYFDPTVLSEAFAQEGSLDSTFALDDR